MTNTVLALMFALGAGSAAIFTPVVRHQGAVQSLTRFCVERDIQVIDGTLYECRPMVAQERYR